MKLTDLDPLADEIVEPAEHVHPMVQLLLCLKTPVRSEQRHENYFSLASSFNVSLFSSFLKRTGTGRHKNVIFSFLNKFP